MQLCRRHSRAPTAPPDARLPAPAPSRARCGRATWRSGARFSRRCPAPRSGSLPTLPSPRPPSAAASYGPSSDPAPPLRPRRPTAQCVASRGICDWLRLLNTHDASVPERCVRCQRTRVFSLTRKAPAAQLRGRGRAPRLLAADGAPGPHAPQGAPPRPARPWSHGSKAHAQKTAQSAPKGLKRRALPRRTRPAWSCFCGLSRPHRPARASIGAGHPRARHAAIQRPLHERRGASGTALPEPCEPRHRPGRQQERRGAPQHAPAAAATARVTATVTATAHRRRACRCSPCPACAWRRASARACSERRASAPCSSRAPAPSAPPSPRPSRAVRARSRRHAPIARPTPNPPSAPYCCPYPCPYCTLPLLTTGRCTGSRIAPAGVCRRHGPPR